MRSPRKVIQERIRSLCADGARFADLGAKVCVYRRGADGEPEYERTLPWLYGGRYDRLAGQYVAPPETIHELRVHTGQVKFLELLWDPALRYVMGLGAPGGGKSLNVITAALLFGIATPQRIIGMPAATWDGAEVVWKKFLALAEPKGWIEETRTGAREITLTNGTLYQFVGMTKKSGSANSPAQGRDWHIAFPDEFQGMDDEAEREIDARGRIDKHFKIMSSATNSAEHYFQSRIGTYTDLPTGAVVRFSGPENCFTPLEQWERMRAKWSPEDYDRIINCLDVPLEGRLFPQFTAVSLDEARPDDRTVRPFPTRPDIGSWDITEQVTRERFGTGYPYVVGIDFGSLTTASVVMKCLRGQRAGEREWWALHEITTQDRGTDYHAKELLAFFLGDPHAFLCIGDPHEYKEVDRSDYSTFKKMGLNIVRASSDVIPYKHRVSMMNALLKAYDGQRRFFVNQGTCEGLRRGLGTLMKGPDGKALRPQQDRHHLGADFSHQPDAAMFGVFPFERIRGTVPPADERVVPARSGRPRR